MSKPTQKTRNARLKWLLSEVGQNIAKVLFLTSTFQACGDSGFQAIEERKLVVATDATLIPMSFIDDSGKISGFEPDLVYALAKEVGVKLELVNVEWAGIFGGLLTNKFDAAVSSITILEERKKKMAFSVPYLKSGVVLVVRKDMEEVNSLNEAKNKDLVIAAQVGTTAYFLLEKDPGIRRKGYQQYGHAITDLIKGEVDAVAGESTGTLYYKANEAKLFQKIKIAGEIITEEHYGIALRKNDVKLVASINSALQTLLENGTIQRLHDKWKLGRAASLPN